MKFQLHKTFAIGLLCLGAFSLPAYSAENAWEGWYGGLSASFNSTNSTTSYAHQHFGNCVNLNFGSEWPGDGCEGNQDYKTSVSSAISSSAAGLFVERLWDDQGRVYGVHLGARGGSLIPASETLILSNAWGDKLNIDVRLKESLDVRAIVGFPQDGWLPFLTAGAVFQKADFGFRQEQPGYDLAVARSKDQWLAGSVWGAGVKKQWDAEWMITAEFLFQKLSAFELSSDGVVLGGGLKYPSTQMEVNSDTRSLRIGIARQF